MTDYAPQPQITVLDTGGQYTHLIARKVRELGVYAEVRPSETPATELTGRKGIIISGGPASVYEPGSPTMDPAILKDGHAVLGNVDEVVTAPVLSRLYGTEIEVVRASGHIFVMSHGSDVERTDHAHDHGHQH